VGDVAQQDFGPVRDEGTREGAGESGHALLEKRPLLELPPEELLDVPGQVDLQDRPPNALCRAAISTVRSQSL
jgi:hypothetical protein